MHEEGRRGEREILFLFFFFLHFFLRSMKSDRRFSSGLKAKLIYAMRATRGHQNLGVSSNSMRYGIFLLVLFSNLKAM